MNQYTIEEKLKYYGSRKNNKRLPESKRKYAKQRSYELHDELAMSRQVTFKSLLGGKHGHLISVSELKKRVGYLFMRRQNMPGMEKEVEMYAKENKKLDQMIAKFGLKGSDKIYLINR